MDERFHALYERRYRSYATELDSTQRILAEWIRRIIDRSIERANLSDMIRPDAKFVLLTNLHNMFAMPIMESGRESPDQVRRKARHDADHILSRATESARSNAETEISSHRVVETVCQEWGRLQSTQATLWSKG